MFHGEIHYKWPFSSIFNSYVKLPEGISKSPTWVRVFRSADLDVDVQHCHRSGDHPTIHERCTGTTNLWCRAVLTEQKAVVYFFRSSHLPRLVGSLEHFCFPYVGNDFFFQRGWNHQPAERWHIIRFTNEEILSVFLWMTVCSNLDLL